MLTSVGDLPRIANAKSGDLSKSIAIEQPPSQIVEKSDKNLLRTGTGPHWPVVDGSKSSEEVAKVESCFTLDRFLNPITRDQTFNDLFNEVQMLNDSMARLNDFYDTDGDFDFEEYQNSDYRMKRPTFESLRQKVTKLIYARTQSQSHTLASTEPDAAHHRTTDHSSLQSRSTRHVPHQVAKYHHLSH